MLYFSQNHISNDYILRFFSSLTRFINWIWPYFAPHVAIFFKLCIENYNRQLYFTTNITATLFLEKKKWNMLSNIKYLYNKLFIGINAAKFRNTFLKFTLIL